MCNRRQGSVTEPVGVANCVDKANTFIHTNGKRSESYCQPSLSQLAHVSALSLSATWGGGRVQWQNLAGCSLIHCGRRRRQDPMPEPDGRSAQREVLLLENSIWHDRNSQTSSALQIPRLKGSHECSSANSVDSALENRAQGSCWSFRCSFELKSFFVSWLIYEVFLDIWTNT